jgi:hypothetical protein
MYQTPFINLLEQLQTPDEIRGRVSAVFAGESNELGELEPGIAAAWLGPVPAVVIGGGATLLVTAVWYTLFPQLAKMGRLPGPKRKQTHNPTPSQPRSCYRYCLSADSR